MKKLVILMAVLLIMTMLPAAYAGKGNTVSPEWYYNDPEGTAYPLGVNDPHYRYDQPPYYSSYTYYPSTAEERLAASVERIGYLGYRTLRKTSPYMRGSVVKTLQMMLNTLGYYDGLAAFLSHMRAEGFLAPEWDGLAIIKSSPEELLEEMDHSHQ